MGHPLSDRDDTHASVEDVDQVLEVVGVRGDDRGVTVS